MKQVVILLLLLTAPPVTAQTITDDALTKLSAVETALSDLRTAIGLIQCPVPPPCPTCPRRSCVRPHSQRNRWSRTPPS